MKPDEIFDIILYQVSTLKGVCESLGGRLHHVKPHGALYNDSAKDPEIAHSIASAVKKIDPKLILFGLSGSISIVEAEKIGLRTASETFADRTYSENGRLTPRSESNALITDPDQAVGQVIGMITNQAVVATNGKSVPIKADTVCIHGDSPNALSLAKAVTQKLRETGVEIKAL